MNKTTYLFLSLFFISCNDSSNNIIIDVYGCTEPSATNYNEEANIDDESCLYDENTYFNLNIDETGQSTLFIFQDTIVSLSIGDEIGLFDSNGIVNSDGENGEILVGTGIWDGVQLEIVTIGSIDLSQFEGPILPGYIENNNMILKIWNGEEIAEVNYTYIAGNGLFNGIFTTVNSIVFD